MTKSDIIILSDIIRSERDAAQRMADHGTADEKHAASIVLVSLRDVAVQLVNRAALDRAAFLHACGIKEST